jgi:NhaP-type Na+/H+ or K+/H+ antiporter
MVLVLAALVSLLADFSNVPLSFMDVLLMACVLSSNDTVAALGLIKEKTYPKLNSVLFGEGIVNDAVVIVLFRTVEKSAMVMEVG